MVSRHHSHYPKDEYTLYSICIVCDQPISCASSDGLYAVRGKRGDPIWHVSHTARTRIMYQERLRKLREGTIDE
jgi:hypothetical protein